MIVGLGDQFEVPGDHRHQRLGDQHELPSDLPHQPHCPLQSPPLFSLGIGS